LFSTFWSDTEKPYIGLAAINPVEFSLQFSQYRTMEFITVWKKFNMFPVNALRFVWESFIDRLPKLALEFDAYIMTKQKQRHKKITYTYVPSRGHIGSLAKGRNHVKASATQ
jgi:hypothetical protein